MKTQIINVLPADVKPGDRVALTGVVDHTSQYVILAGGIDPTFLTTEEIAAATITREVPVVIETGCRARGTVTGRLYKVLAVAEGYALTRSLAGGVVSIPVANLERI